MLAVMQKYNVKQLYPGHFMGRNPETPQRIKDMITLSRDVMAGRIKGEPNPNGMMGLNLIVSDYGVRINYKEEKVERGPYTLEPISDGIYQIQDYNSVRGRGSFTNAQGQAGYNNCSDMYLVVGNTKALLIDLSNNVQWADNATEALRSLVSEYSRGRELIITITHNHGDHLGMLPAYANDAKVHFWVPKAEFPERGRFPEGRTTLFDDNASIDLGGITIKTMKVEGHTPGSTLFFADGRDMVFTGDAIGSGSGVWIFTAEGFAQYKQGVARLINYIGNPANGINKEKLIIYGGHSLQGMAVWPLGVQYILDMEELIKRIEAGSGYDTAPMTGNQMLDTHYKYGTATITWSRAAEKKYLELLNKERR
jgi:glyoxylase-like metal-dependent hydrolase (beta-lactamase superfamily II)